VIPTDGPTALDYPDSSVLTLTNASIPDLPADGSTAPVRLLADVETVDLSNPADDGAVRVQRNVLLASLVPGSVESQKIAALFSPLNAVTLRVKGSVPVHLVGYLDPVSDDGEEEEEEEAGEPA
jgi:hypothetical protein